MAAPKAGGKGLNGKVGPVPVKAAVFIVALIGGYLLFRHLQANKAAPTSSGTQPSVADASPYTAPQDATGGGASGGGSQDNGFVDSLFALVGSSNQSLADALASESQRTPTTTSTTTNTTYSYYPSTGQTDTGGGNTSPPSTGPTPSQPATTHTDAPASPFVSPGLLTQIAAGASSGASPSAIEKENQAAWNATETAYAPGTPLSSANYGGNRTLTTAQTKARNKRQLA